MPTSVVLPRFAGEIADYANKCHYEAMLRSLQNCARRVGLAFVTSTAYRPARHQMLTVEQLNHLCLAIVTIRCADMSPNLNSETLRIIVDINARDGTGLVLLRYFLGCLAEMGISMVRDDSATTTESAVHDPNQNLMTATFHQSLDDYLAAQTTLDAPSWMPDGVWPDEMTKMQQERQSETVPYARPFTNSPGQPNENNLFSLYEGLEEVKFPHPPISQ